MDAALCLRSGAKDRLDALTRDVRAGGLEDSLGLVAATARRAPADGARLAATLVAEATLRRAERVCPSLSTAHADRPTTWSLLARDDGDGPLGVRGRAPVTLSVAAGSDRGVLLVVIGDPATDRLLLVSLADPQLGRLPVAQRTGLRDSGHGRLTVERLDLAETIGVPNRLELSSWLRAHSWLATAATATGIARAALSETVQRLNERRQFGHRLVEFAALRDRVGALAARTRAAEAAWAQAGAAVETGTSSARDDAAAALLGALETAGTVTEAAVHLHGAHGYVTGTVEQLMRDAASLRARAAAGRPARQHLATATLDRVAQGPRTREDR